MATVGAGVSSSSSAASFKEWMDAEEFELGVAIRHEHGRWFALLIQFDITGTGGTRQEAISEAFALLFAYLRAHFDDGASFSSAVRPIPFGLRVRIEAEAFVASILRRISVRVPFADESTYALPPGRLSKLNPC